MDRAKFVASAFIGIVCASNSYEFAHGQTSSRFIVQPQKAKQPAVPEPTVAPTETKAASQVPVAKVPAEGTAAGTAGPSGSPPLTPTANEPKVAEPKASEPKATVQASTKTTSSEAEGTRSFSFDSLLEFPSLMPASSPDLSFDSLESLATVPSTAFEEEVAKFAAQDLKLKEAAPSQASSDTQLATQTPMSTQDSDSTWTQPNARSTSSSGGLQWTSRAAANRSTGSSSNSQASQTHSTPTRTESTSQSSSSQHPSSLNSGFSPTSPNTSFSPSLQTHQAFAEAKEQAAANTQLLTQIADRVGAIESKIDKRDEPAERAQVRAALVSANITNDPRFAKESSEQLTVGRLESPQGWQAISQRLINHVSRCESLLRRGAFCSAREEGESACLLLIRHIDLIDNLYRCEPAWRAANQSLREAEDFLAVQRMSDSDGLRRLIDSHHTPVLKGKNLSEMSPLTAAQHYRVYAEMQLIEATQGHPWASELLYAVGRTYQAEADATPAQVDVLRMRAIAFYRASRTTLPSNAVACNQLGYLLLQMDRNEEAREVLAAAVTLKSDPAFLSNFAEASRRLGDTQSVSWAAQSVAAIRSRTPVQPPVPPFIEVTPEEFVAISPRAIGPQPSMGPMTTNESGASAPVAPAYKSAAAPRTNQTR